MHRVMNRVHLSTFVTIKDANESTQVSTVRSNKQQKGTLFVHKLSQNTERL